MEILKHFKGKLGYTLLELIVVLALFAILLSIAIPSTGIITHIQEKNELRTFKRDILSARNSAVIEKCVYILKIDNDKSEYNISKSTNATYLIKNVDFKYGIKVSPGNLTTRINFNSTGAPSDAGTINLTNRKGEKIEIRITPATGSVNLYINNKSQGSL